MPPVPQTPPVQSLGSQFAPVKRDSKEVDNGQLASNLNGNQGSNIGKDNRFSNVPLPSYVSKIIQQLDPVDTANVVSEAVPPAPPSVPAPPQTLPGYILVPYRSPSPSEFGDNGDEKYGLVKELPENILKYLDDHDLEAHYVVADGNCLYRALTYGPEWTKHGLARMGETAYLRGVKQSDNFLAEAVSKGDINEIDTDRSWMDMKTGELQLKAAAESMKVNIDFMDGDKLQRELEKSDDDMRAKVETLRFGPTPILTHGKVHETVESRFGPDKATTLFLWKEHYYPLFTRGALPDLRNIPSHHVGAQVPSPSSEPSRPPLSSGSDTRINDDAGPPKIGKVLETITKHQAGLSESRPKRKTEPSPKKEKIERLSQPSSKLPTMTGVRPDKEHWDPYHDSLVLYKGKTDPNIEELPPKPLKSGMEKGVNPPIEQTGMNGWVAMGLGAVVATLVTVAGALGLKFWRGAQSPARNERRVRDVKYYSDGDDEFDVREKW